MFFIDSVLCNQMQSVDTIMKNWLTTHLLLPKDHGLQAYIEYIWPKICIQYVDKVSNDITVDIQSCPADEHNNRITGLYTKLNQLSEIRIALDKSYVKITHDEITIPVCHPEFHLSFITVKHADILKYDSIKFKYCNHTNFFTFTPEMPTCCNSAKLPTNINELDIQRYNCKDKRKHSCIANVNTNLLSDAKACISGPRTVSAYSVCTASNNTFNLTASEYMMIYKESLDAYHVAVNTKTALYHEADNQTMILTLRYKNDIIIAGFPYNTMINMNCEPAEKQIEPLMSTCDERQTYCKQCKDNLCNQHDECINGCKNTMYQSPKCTDKKIITTNIKMYNLSTSICYCLKQNVHARLIGKDYCTGEDHDEALSNDICVRDVGRTLPLTPLARSRIISSTISQALVVTPESKTIYMNAPSFPVPCEDITSYNYQINSNADACKCNASVCLGDICTDYSGCFIGCKDHNSIRPWCNETTTIHEAQLFPPHEIRYSDVPDNLNDDVRMIMMYLLSSMLGVTMVTTVSLVLGIEYRHRKQKKPKES